jgi:hypothetical protein
MPLLLLLLAGFLFHIGLQLRLGLRSRTSFLANWHRHLLNSAAAGQASETPQKSGWAAPNLAVTRDYRNTLVQNQACCDLFIKKF